MTAALRSYLRAEIDRLTRARFATECGRLWYASVEKVERSNLTKADEARAT